MTFFLAGKTGKKSGILETVAAIDFCVKQYIKFTGIIWIDRNVTPPPP